MNYIEGINSLKFEQLVTSHLQKYSTRAGCMKGG